MRTIYRLENKDGNGPYHLIESFRKKRLSTIYNILMDHNDNFHPNWYDDFNSNQWLKIMDWKDTHKPRSGFLTIQSLFSWFGGLVPLFYKHTDFKIVKYQVNEKDILLSQSGKQIIFKKTK